MSLCGLYGARCKNKKNLTTPSPLCSFHLPKGLLSLTFGKEFNQSLDGLTLPTSLQRLPISLQSLTFGMFFNKSLATMTLPNSLQSLTFGFGFDKSLERVTLPSSLQSLASGEQFQQSLEGLTLPGTLSMLRCNDVVVTSLPWESGRDCYVEKKLRCCLFIVVAVFQFGTLCPLFLNTRRASQEIDDCNSFVPS